MGEVLTFVNEIFTNNQLVRSSRECLIDQNIWTKITKAYLRVLTFVNSNRSKEIHFVMIVMDILIVLKKMKSANAKSNN